MRLKNLLNKYFRLSPFHPQWLALRKEPLEFARANCTQDKQRLLDIGSGRGGLKPLLSEAVEYVGFDYPSTGIDRYQGSPDVLGTAEALPFAPNCFDSLVCLEVMEHLPDPQGALEEMYRVLRPSGKVLISIPFAYPIHDAPYDFQRLTRYQLVRICERAGFVVASISETAHPIETSG
ncbi:MAG: class I SAM-dependent methyltransferase, partial [bacterium]